jgi:hypothetical protein
LYGPSKIIRGGCSRSRRFQLDVGTPDQVFRTQWERSSMPKLHPYPKSRMSPA